MARAPLLIRHAPDELEAALVLYMVRIGQSLGYWRELLELERAELFRVEEGGTLAGYYALGVKTLEGGEREGCILAAAAYARQDLTAHALPLVLGQFIGVQSVRVVTKRRGLVRKLARLGWAHVAQPRGGLFEMERRLC